MQPLFSRMIDKLFEDSSKINKELLISAFNSLPKSIQNLPPNEVDFFIRSYDTINEEKLDISLLTPNNLIYDLDYSNNERLNSVSQLGKTSYITLQVIYPDVNSDDPNPARIPFRANLKIYNGTNYFIYEVEGNRSSVKSLIAYANICISRLDALSENWNVK